jgi:dihydrofolate reductase
MSPSQRPVLALIAAVAKNGVIGHDNQLLWHLPQDLQHFRRVTMGCPVIMGRRTWESLPPRFRPLPGRINVVVTRDPQWQAAGALRAGSLDEAVALAGEVERVFVIGGGELYAAALPRADELVLTELDRDFAGETRFPDWSPEDFERVERETLPSGQGFDLHFSRYRRRPPAF